MAAETPDDLTDEERALFGAYGVASDLAVRCRQLREMNVSVSEAALEKVIIYLMTELWDQGFSQTDIHKALTAALADMNRYAAGNEHR